MRERLGSTFRAFCYFGASLGLGLACMIVLPALLVSAVLCLIVAGVLVAPWPLRGLGRLADLERARAGRRIGRTVRPHGSRGRTLRELIAEPGTVRDLRWLPVMMLVGPVVGVLGVGLALLPFVALAAAGLWWLFPAEQPVRVLANLPITSWSGALTLGIVQVVLAAALALFVLPRLATGMARLSVWLLAPTAAQELAELNERVQTLQESRAGAVDAHGAELRRIERDLHDGTQASLVSIAMRLGLAERQLDRDPQAAASLLAQAREGAEGAMTELRGVLRSIYPPILADRGLAGALSAVAARCAVPTKLEVAELGDVVAPAEAAVYFAVTEALTNVAKHSGAAGAEVRVVRLGDRLLAEIVDDGRGGVDEAAIAAGTGIAGIRRRFAALDGEVSVTAPAGGPTTIRLECPCGS